MLNNWDTTDNFIKHHSLNNRNKNYFDRKESIPAPLKVNHKNDIRIQDFMKRETENQSE